MANTYTQKTIAWKHGINSLYAGTPLDANGKPVNDATAVGILAEDVVSPNRTAKVLTSGTWDEDANTGSGIEISDAVKQKLKDIAFSRKQNRPLATAQDAGIVAPDNFDLDVLAVPTPASMPTAETASNSGHATVTLADHMITITLDCEVSDLADANHGTSWGTHKWLGFGIDTGLASIVGVKFTDDTGASATMASSDATEASDLGMNAGQFVLYIKAEDAKYLTGEKYFVLQAAGTEPETIYMKIVETTN